MLSIIILLSEVHLFLIRVIFSKLQAHASTISYSSMEVPWLYEFKSKNLFSIDFFKLRLSLTISSLVLLVLRFSIKLVNLMWFIKSIDP
jgi:hypothetical protein